MASGFIFISGFNYAEKVFPNYSDHRLNPLWCLFQLYIWELWCSERDSTLVYGDLFTSCDGPNMVHSSIPKSETEKLERLNPDTPLVGIRFLGWVGL